MCEFVTCVDTMSDKNRAHRLEEAVQRKKKKKKHFGLSGNSLAARVGKWGNGRDKNNNESGLSEATVPFKCNFIYSSHIFSH